MYAVTLLETTLHGFWPNPRQLVSALATLRGWTRCDKMIVEFTAVCLALPWRGRQRSCPGGRAGDHMVGCGDHRWVGPDLGDRLGRNESGKKNVLYMDVVCISVRTYQEGYK